MSDWQSVLQEIDDDYLIGISNKGIVKRAYKDMETIPCEISQKTVFEENEVKYMSVRRLCRLNCHLERALVLVRQEVYAAMLCKESWH